MSDNATARFFRYLNWLFNPFHGLKTTEVYDLIGTSSLTEHALYLNLGYWRAVDTIDEASDELAMADCPAMYPEQSSFLHSSLFRSRF